MITKIYIQWRHIATSLLGYSRFFGKSILAALWGSVVRKESSLSPWVSECPCLYVLSYCPSDSPWWWGLQCFRSSHDFKSSRWIECDCVSVTLCCCAIRNNRSCCEVPGLHLARDFLAACSNMLRAAQRACGEVNSPCTVTHSDGIKKQWQIANGVRANQIHESERIFLRQELGHQLTEGEGHQHAHQTALHHDVEQHRVVIALREVGECSTSHNQ